MQDEVNNLEINSHFDLRLQATLAIPTLHTGRDNARLKVRRDFFHGVRDRPSGHRCRVDVGDVLAKGLAGRLGIAGLQLPGDVGQASAEQENMDAVAVVGHRMKEVQ